MDCVDARVLIHGHLDGELDLATDVEVQRHIEDCARCVGEYAALRSMRMRLRDEDFRFDVPEALKERIRRAIPTPETLALPRLSAYQAQRGPWMTRAIRFAIPMAIGAMLALIIVPRAMSPSADQRLAIEVVTSHVRSLMAEHLMDVASTDQHTVKPWFNGKLDFSPPVTDFAKQGFPLVGGRLDYIDGRPVAALVYQRNKHVINVFMWPRIRVGSSGIRKIETENGYNVDQLIVAGMNCWVVSDLNRQELDKFAALLRTEA